MQNVHDKIKAWENEGRNLLEELRAERDTVSARIEQDRAYRDDLGAEIKAFEVRFGLAPVADGGPPRGMRRREIAAVPVEKRVPYARAKTPAETPAEMPEPWRVVLDAVKQGPANMTDIVARIRTKNPVFDGRTVSGPLKGLKNAGLVSARESGDPEDPRLVWFVAG